MVGRGRGLQLECVGTGNPGNVDNIAFSWTVDTGGGVEVVTGDGGRVRVGGRWLNFTSVELGDSGLYTCVVSHELTSDLSVNAVLTVEGKPF